MLDDFKSNGQGRIAWDATDDLNQGVPAGLYIYSLNTEGVRISRKMLLIDGQQIHSASADVHIPDTEGSILSKSMSDIFQLLVTGDDIEIYPQWDLKITENTTLDVTARRAAMDFDGNTYRTVKIGNQWWLVDNLQVTRFRNGDEIPEVTDGTEWSSLSNGARCKYENDVNYLPHYGRIYNWYAVNDVRGITPLGWHVPTKEEWQILVDYLGGDQVAGGKMKLTDTIHWQSPNTGATNESGFCGLPGGCRFQNGSYANRLIQEYHWTRTEYNDDRAWLLILNYDYSGISQDYLKKQSGFSVRCVRD